MAREERSMRNFSVGCWNVTTLKYALAPDHLMIALKDYRYDIIALSETHLLGQEEVCKGRMLLSGGRKHYAGVGILMSSRAKRTLLTSYHMSDRMMAARFQLTKGTLLFVAVYAPISSADTDVLDDFYEQLQDWIDNNRKTRDILIVAGDFNAKLGNQHTLPVMGPHGIGKEMLVATVSLIFAWLITSQLHTHGSANVPRKKSLGSQGQAMPKML